jgi:protein-S-isoprenylcysteine O-methyltransferase Ste14
MYAAALVLLLGIPLALGSSWGMLIVLALVPVLIWRLMDEERFLAEHLPGYREYQGRVRYRLLPPIW